MSWEHPDNPGGLRHLAKSWNRGGIQWSVSAPDVPDACIALETHPDLLERLWDEITGPLPEPCRWVISGWPPLVHPGTGIEFGFAGGPHVYGQRRRGQ